MFIDGSGLLGNSSRLQSSFKNLANREEPKPTNGAVMDQFMGAISDRSVQIQANQSTAAAQFNVSVVSENTEAVVRAGQDQLYSVSSALDKLGSVQLQEADIQELSQILVDVSSEVKQVSEFSSSVDLQVAAQIMDQSATTLDAVDLVGTGADAIASIQTALDGLSSVISSAEQKLPSENSAGRQQAVQAVDDMRTIESLLTAQIASGEGFTPEEAAALNQQLSDISDQLQAVGNKDASAKGLFKAERDNITSIQWEITNAVVDQAASAAGQEVLQTIRADLQVVEKIFKKLEEGTRTSQITEPEGGSQGSEVDAGELATFNLQSVRSSSTDLEGLQEIAKQLLESVVGSGGATDIQNLADGNVYSSSSVRQDAFLRLLDQNLQSRA